MASCVNCSMDRDCSGKPRLRGEVSRQEFASMTLRRNRHTRNHSCGIDGLIGACMHRAKNIEVARVDRATSIVAIRRFMRTSSRRDPGPAEACCTDDSCRRIAQGRRSCRAADRGCRRQEHRFQIQCKRDDHGPGSPGAREPGSLRPWGLGFVVSGACGLVGWGAQSISGVVQQCDRQNNADTFATIRRRT